MRIALDVMGGDKAPLVNIEGAKKALQQHPEITKICLVGDEDTIAKLLVSWDSVLKNRVEIVHAEQVVAMDDPALAVFRLKKKSSISVAVNLVKEGSCDAFVSAGNTGSCVAAATIKLRLLKGVERAGISSMMPNEYGFCQLLDAGANPEAKSDHLVTYAYMGAIYAKYNLGITQPRVGIMSNGEEDAKGNSLTKETFNKLQQISQEPVEFEFIGNIEGHDLLHEKVDVCVCDGFTGNIVLKSCESTAKAISKWLRQEIKGNFLTAIGGLLAKKAFIKLSQKMHYENIGGSLLLGVNGVVVIAHGGSSATAIYNAIRVAAEAVQNNINPKIEQILAKNNK